MSCPDPGLGPAKLRNASPSGPAFNAVYSSIRQQVIPVPSTAVSAAMSPTTLFFGVVSQKPLSDAALVYGFDDHPRPYDSFSPGQCRRVYASDFEKISDNEAARIRRPYRYPAQEDLMPWKPTSDLVKDI